MSGVGDNLSLPPNRKLTMVNIEKTRINGYFQA
jgi:hypothetical protein